MTKEEILAITAGLDLDFEVDIKVMAGKGGYLACPSYSTDISAAWQVVEKMENDGWLWEARKEVQYERDGWLWEARRYPHKSIYEFEFYRLKEGTHHCSGIEDSIPEAICKAALLTVIF